MKIVKSLILIVSAALFTFVPIKLPPDNLENTSGISIVVEKLSEDDIFIGKH